VRKIKWPEPETWIIIVCVIVMVLFMAYVLTGCSTIKKAQKMSVMWSNGGCVFIAEGMSVQEAKEMTRDWDFNKCVVKIHGVDTSGNKSPIKLKKEE